MNQHVHLLSLEKDPDPRSPITPGCLGPVTFLFNWRKKDNHVNLKKDYVRTHHQDHYNILNCAMCKKDRKVNPKNYVKQNFKVVHIKKLSIISGIAYHTNANQRHEN